jgi:hypothetical protein
MPWRLEPMKDVGDCDKPWGAVYQAVIHGSPNGETRHRAAMSPLPEHIGQVEGTRGIETSQYPQGKESNRDSLSSGERNGKSLNPDGVRAWRRCRPGVVGAFRQGAPAPWGELQSGSAS